MNITVTVNQATVDAIQYFLDRNDSLDIDRPGSTAPTTVAEAIQQIVDTQTSKYVRRHEIKKDELILETVKGDSSLKATVDAAITAKDPKPPK